MRIWESLLADRSFLWMLGAVALLLALYTAVKRRALFRRVFIYLTIAYNLVYLIWRAGYTLPLRYGVASAVLGLLLLLAELAGFWQSGIYRLLFLRPYRLTPRRLEEWKSPPTVDVFIATFNESTAILRKTAVACQNLAYPADKLRIYLCDDGKRADVRALCEELGVTYLSRSDNRHAKAGNINEALAKTDGAFVMLLDADMVPKSTFLEKTLGYFLDDRVGFVQTPQMFVNPDPFQYNLRFNQSIPNEQDFFMLDIQAGRAAYNAVLHVGTNAVFRRSALDEIGGIPTGTITEDMATGMLLQAKGYQSVFIREVLCTGLSVESFHDLIRQRERWCRGNIQVTRKWNPLTIRGLNFTQRMIYLDGLIYWFFGVQKVIFLLCPLIYLLFGTVILNASVHDLLLFWLPSYVASFLSYRALSNKSRSITWSHIYEVAMAPYLATAALMEALFSRPIPFRVTPKGLNTDKTTFAFRTALPFLVLLGMTVAGWLLTGARVLAGGVPMENLLINLAWSAYNGVAILMSILVCVERPRKRTAERLSTDEPVVLSFDHNASCRVTDISETGVKIECGAVEGDDLAGRDVHLMCSNIGLVKGKIVWANRKRGRTTLGVAFQFQSSETYQKLLKLIADRNEGYHGNR
ncbi:MAG: glycosyltransferase [Clostridiales bacterium]|nr:glycosyltransferase [Clostridiales bacterium]